MFGKYQEAMNEIEDSPLGKMSEKRLTWLCNTLPAKAEKYIRKNTHLTRKEIATKLVDKGLFNTFDAAYHTSNNVINKKKIAVKSVVTNKDKVKAYILKNTHKSANEITTALVEMKLCPTRCTANATSLKIRNENNIVLAVKKIKQATTTKISTPQGIFRSANEAAAHYGITNNTVWNRVNKGTEGFKRISNK